MLTDRHQCATAGRDLAATVEAAVTAGASAVLFREKDLGPTERRELGERVAAACAGADLLVASDPDLARSLRARGVHLAATDPWPDDADLVLGRSCHSAAELADATAHAAAYALVSPVFPTASKPGYGPPLGLEGLAALAAGTSLPVLALGGVGPERVADCLRSGARGVAVMGGVMAAEDPGATVRSLLAEARR